MKAVETVSYPVSIFIAGDYEAAHEMCLRYCRDVGLCVTVTRTSYVYTGGAEGGVIVGLINYPRFPSEPAEIFARALDLGHWLCRHLAQESFTVQAPNRTLWVSFRELAEREDHSAVFMNSTSSAHKSVAPPSQNARAAAAKIVITAT